MKSDLLTSPFSLLTSPFERTDFKMNNTFTTAPICYRYDGSFYGMLSCVFESFEKKEIPMQITYEDFSLFPIKEIETDETKAKRILNGIKKKIGVVPLEYIKYSFLANIHEKEIALIHFLQEGFKQGHKFIQTVTTALGFERTVIAQGLNNPHITKIIKGVDLLTLESQRFIQFARFNDHNGTLVSIIEPENIVLPLLANHFAERYPNEQFLIYDKTHSLALIYADYKISIQPIEHYELPPATEQEKQFQKLWQLFYNTIEINERHNPRCRMNFMPKKYWKNMTEFMKD